MAKFGVLRRWVILGAFVATCAFAGQDIVIAQDGGGETEATGSCCDMTCSVSCRNPRVKCEEGIYCETNAMWPHIECCF